MFISLFNESESRATRGASTDGFATSLAVVHQEGSRLEGAEQEGSQRGVPVGSGAGADAGRGSSAASGAGPDGRRWTCNFVLLSLRARVRSPWFPVCVVGVTALGMQMSGLRGSFPTSVVA